MRLFGIGFVILAAMLWGVSGGLAGILMDKGWDPLVISFYRGAVGLVCLLLWLLISSKRNTVKNSSKVITWSILAGIGVAGNFSFYFLSISETGVAVAATLMYTAPLFVFVISFLFRMERATPFKLISILIVMVGISMLTNVYQIGIGSLNTLGIAAGLLSGLSYALFIFGFKYASEDGHPPFVLSVAFIAFTIILLIFIDHGQALAVIYSSDLVWFIVLGIIGAGISFFFYMEGLKRTSPTAASIIAMVEPVTASLFGLVVLGEVLNLTQTIGIGIILITITILSTRLRS
ncbi:DMT family transporter [Thalassobacillus devorans]|uniref:DMT family transporter n=1 Tax=Thalassobacillus devorans TaxID=279813 RepID=UPI000490A0CB|nr:EamA family transporter [Thalassobacillus devorans]